LLQIAVDEANLVGLDKAKSTMEARKKRLEGRVDIMRTMLASALEILEEKRFERPLATVTLKPTPRKVLITDEAAIPAQFWKTPDPTLSKKDLADALKAHEETLQGKQPQSSCRGASDDFRFLLGLSGVLRRQRKLLEHFLAPELAGFVPCESADFERAALEGAVWLLGRSIKSFELKEKAFSVGRRFSSRAREAHIQALEHLIDAMDFVVHVSAARYLELKLRHDRCRRGAASLS
jgi:hypothetical protein